MLCTCIVWCKACHDKTEENILLNNVGGSAPQYGRARYIYIYTYLRIHYLVPAVYKNGMYVGEGLFFVVNTIYMHGKYIIMITKLL